MVVRQLLDDVLSAALHPSGTMLLVGLHDKLTLYSIALVRFQAGCAWSKGLNQIALGLGHFLLNRQQLSGGPI